MKLFKEGLVRIDCGSAFHNFEAEYEKERSYNAVRDLGTERSPFSDNKAVLTYKALNNLASAYISGLLKPVSETHTRSFKSFKHDS